MQKMMQKLVARNIRDETLGISTISIPICQKPGKYTENIMHHVISFSIANSTSKALVSGTGVSVVSNSVCLMSLSLCIFNSIFERNGTYI